MMGWLGRNRSTRSSGRGSDQALLDLVNAIRDLEERFEGLERRFDALGTAAEPHEDVLMETQLHVARLSAEVSRLTVELRGNIAELSSRAGMVFDDNDTSPELAGDESFEDLSADSPARAPTPHRSSGWQPSG